MKTPVCEVCSCTGSLCASCQSRLDSGEISPADVSACAALHEVSKTFPIDGVELEKAFDAPRLVVLVTSSNPGVLIGRGGHVVSELSKRLGKHVKVIGSHQERALALEELLAPLKPIGLNELFSAGGKKYKLRLSRQESHRLPMPQETLQRVLQYLYGAPLEISFE